MAGNHAELASPRRRFCRLGLLITTALRDVTEKTEFDYVSFAANKATRRRHVRPLYQCNVVDKSWFATYTRES